MEPHLKVILGGARIVGSLGVNKKKPTLIYEKLGRLFTLKARKDGGYDVQYLLDIIGGKSEDVHTVHNP